MSAPSTLDEIIERLRSVDLDATVAQMARSGLADHQTALPLATAVPAGHDPLNADAVGPFGRTAGTSVFQGSVGQTGL